MMKKSLFLTVLVASLMLVSTLSLSSCKKEAPVGETVALRYEHSCMVCQRELVAAPAGTPFPPPYDNTSFSCYHLIQLGEVCPLANCTFQGLHHYHFCFVTDHNTWWSANEHIGGGTD